MEGHVEIPGYFQLKALATLVTMRTERLHDFVADLGSVGVDVQHVDIDATTGLGVTVVATAAPTARSVIEFSIGGK